MSIFKESNGKWSSKRTIGILGVAIVTALMTLGKLEETAGVMLIGIFSGLIGLTSFSKTTNPGSPPPPPPKT